MSNASEILERTFDSCSSITDFLSKYSFMISSCKVFRDGMCIQVIKLHNRFVNDRDSTSKSGKSLWMINFFRRFSNSVLLTSDVFPKPIVDWLEAVDNFGISAKISGASPESSARKCFKRLVVACLVAVKTLIVGRQKLHVSWSK